MNTLKGILREYSVHKCGCCSIKGCVLLMVFYALLSVEACCQKVDSLKALIALSDGKERCDVLYQIAYEYVDVNNWTALKYANRAMRMATTLGDTFRIVKTTRLKAMAFRRVGDLDSSIIVSLPILPIIQRHGYASELMLILNGLGNAYIGKAEYDKALEYHLKSLDLRKRNGTKSDVSITLSNLGLIFYRLANYTVSLSYYRQSLTIKEEINSNIDLDLLLINMGLCYAEMGDFAQARKLIKKTINSCNGICSNIIMQNVEQCHGIIYLGENQDDDAEEHLLRSLNYAVAAESEETQLEDISYLTRLYLEKGRLDLVAHYLSMAEKVATEGTPFNRELLKIYKNFTMLFEKLGDFRKTAFYQKKYIQLRDSIYDEELTTNLMKIEADYIVREHSAKIRAQSQILQLNQDVIYRQRFLNLFIGGFAMLLVVLISILVKNNGSRKLANQRLEERVRERTIELEVSRNLLVRTLDERNFQMTRISNDVKRTLVTIKGLCFLGMKDTEEEATSEYMQKIDVTSDRLLTIVNRFRFVHH